MLVMLRIHANGGAGRRGLLALDQLGGIMVYKEWFYMLCEYFGLLHKALCGFPTNKAPAGLYTSILYLNTSCSNLEHLGGVLHAAVEGMRGTAVLSFKAS
jgi:hypothetical protein